MANSDDLAINDYENALSCRIVQQTFIKTKKKFVCKIYKVFNDNEYVFISTRQERINKYLSKIKSRGTHKNKILVEILKGQYNCEFVENYEYHGKDELANKLIEINDKYKKENCKEIDLKYGLSNEEKVLCKIQNYFTNDEIVKSVYKYSVFDFMGIKSKYLYELKTNRDKYNDYPTAIIGLNKVIKHTKQIFLFQFTTDTTEHELYYFIKPNDFETTYNKRQIFLRARNIYNWVYDIPREELKLIKKYETYNLDIDITDNELFTHFYKLDRVRADIEN